MRFLSMIRVDETTGQAPSEQLMTEMGKLIEQMTREGKLSERQDCDRRRKVCACGCAAASCPTVDGPFTETNEVIGGFAILEAGSMQDAVELTQRFLAIHGTEWNIECEVRQMGRDGCRCMTTKERINFQRPTPDSQERAGRLHVGSW